MGDVSRTYCQVCKVHAHKYKCPKCRLKYCSVHCYKKHIEVKCQPQSDVVYTNRPYTVPAVDGTDDDELEDKVPDEKLQLLAKSKEVLGILNNPHLRDMLLELDAADSPPHAIAEAMMEPIFVEFVDKCLQVVTSKAAT